MIIKIIIVFGFTVFDCKDTEICLTYYFLMSQKLSLLRKRGYTSTFRAFSHKIFFNFAPRKPIPIQ